MTEMKTMPNGTALNHMPSKHKDNPEQDMSKAKILKNMTVVCLVFLLHFSAKHGLDNLQSTLNMEKNVGVVYQSVIFGALMFSSLFLPKLIIKKLGCKLTIVFSILMYVPYVAANVYPRLETLVPTAFLIGLASAPLWSAKCTYLNKISAMYARESTENFDVVTSNFFGIFYMMYQNAQIWGSLVSFLVLRPIRTSTNETVARLNSSIYTFAVQSMSTDHAPSNFTCGAQFFNQSNENLEPPPASKRNLLVGIYLTLVFVAAAITVIFLDPLEKKAKKEDDERALLKVVATLKHMKKTEQLLLIPLTVFCGIEQAFILSEFTRAYVACAWGLHSVGIVFICFGVVNAAVSFVSGRIVKYISRRIVMVVGTAATVGVCIALFLWNPTGSPFVDVFLVAGAWGVSDAIWQTNLNALYGVLFRTQEEAGFANYKLWESLGLSLAFAYSSLLNVAAKIYILLGFLITGMFGYVVVEVLTAKRSVFAVTNPS